METEATEAAAAETPAAETREAGRGIRLDWFWYVACRSEDLPAGTVLARRILGEHLALFRDARGHPRALHDRCLHRNAPLSAGRVNAGKLRCGYHGWAYDGDGRICDIPSLGPETSRIGSRCARSYAIREEQGYVYVRPSASPRLDFEPFPSPRWGERGWSHIRLLNVFNNTVTNCAENFVDIPHTAYVHPGIFRVERRQKLSALVTREDGSVRTEYRGETDNFGWFSWFLNPSKRPIRHVDSFHMPNVTCVEYEFGPRRRFIITSQSVPVGPEETWVYTDLTYDYGWLSALARPLVRWQGQRVIDQDIDILARQMAVIRREGERFTHAPADVIHVFIESVRRELEAGRDPRLLPPARQEIEFWV